MTDARFELYAGDCLDTLRGMAESCVDSIVTDPPYGLAFMGKKWDYDVPSTEIWAECLRVLKPGGHLLAFAGTRTQHRMAVRIEDAGFEIRDMIAWVYGSGFPKSRNGPWGGTALKPALEPITMARKPLAGTVAANTEKFGTGALNIDGCRVSGESMPRNTGRGGLPRRHEDEQRGGGVVSQPHLLGRWPANLIHDGSMAVLGEFPQATGALAPVKGTEVSAKTANVFGDFQGRSSSNQCDGGGSAARFFYCAKASKRDRNDGCEAIAAKQYSHDGRETPIDNAYQRNSSNSHPTVKPTDLMAYLCRLVTPPGGLVLDPFMGSGSTGKAAMREGFTFIGCELDPEYFAIAKVRIDHEIARTTPEQKTTATTDQRDLFAEVSL